MYWKKSLILQVKIGEGTLFLGVMDFVGRMRSMLPYVFCFW